MPVMHLPSHLAISWLVGCRLEHRRDRVLVAWAGVAPDLDALTALGGLEFYGRWHHVLTHGLFAALGFAVLIGALGIDKPKVGLLSLVTFHLHLICDLVGSGKAWGIAYLYPITAKELVSPIRWELASWQNVSITAVVLGVIGWVGVTKGRTFAEAWLPQRAELAVVGALRQRFGG